MDENKKYIVTIFIKNGTCESMFEFVCFLIRIYTNFLWSHAVYYSKQKRHNISRPSIQWKGLDVLKSKPTFFLYINILYIYNYN